MDKIYQPIVIERMEEIIGFLEESKFFEENEIDDLTFSRKYMLDKLTEKFIEGNIEDAIFSETEFEECLREMIAGSVLNELIKKGYVNSYEDDNTEEVFFLTKEGREYVEKNLSGDTISFID